MAAATRLRHTRMPFPIRLRWAAARARMARHVRLRRASVVIASLLWFVIVSDAAVSRQELMRSWGSSEGVVVAGAPADIGARHGSAV